MQTEDEFCNTCAPTSRFEAIHPIISIATQKNLALQHWDIFWAFMTADIDTYVSMDLPQGSYHLTLLDFWGYSDRYLWPRPPATFCA